MDYYFISDLIVLICAFLAFIYGLIRLISLKESTFAQIVVFAAGCVAVGAVILLIASVAAVIFIRHSVVPSDDDTESYEEKTYGFSEAPKEDSSEADDFTMTYSDRLAGFPVTSRTSEDGVMQVTYADGGYARRTYTDTADSAPQEDWPETSEHSVSGFTATLK